MRKKGVWGPFQIHTFFSIFKEKESECNALLFFFVCSLSVIIVINLCFGGLVSQAGKVSMSPVFKVFRIWKGI